MCEYCEGRKPVHENLVCFMAGSIRFIHIVKHKFGHYLSISTWGKFGKNQKFIKTPKFKASRFKGWLFFLKKLI